jgi:hypothetical protein
MFIGAEVRIPVAAAAATARLANLVRGDRLMTLSAPSWDEMSRGLMRVGPSALVFRLVEAEFGELTVRGGAARVAIRWNPAGPAGRLVPALDADLTLTADGDHAAVLRLDGVYRPPLGIVGTGLDDAILHRVASATMRGFIARTGHIIASPEAGAATAGDVPSWSPQPDVI